MRKLKLQMQVTLDGFVANVNGELGWMVWDWDDELKDYVWNLTEPVDLILLGRKMTAGFIDAWTSRLDDPESGSFARKMVETPKIVFSRSLENAEWKNTSIAKADLKEEITKLKTADGGDIIAYGGAAFVSSLVKNNLFDEYHLFVNPAALGKGMTIFGELEEKLNLRLADSRSFSCGIVGLFYEPRDGAS
jgi:dihydrofolate reductase